MAATFPDEPHECGRLTNRGKPCRRIVPPWSLGCTAHTNEVEQERAVACATAYRLGVARGRKLSREEGGDAQYIVELEKELAELHAKMREMRDAMGRRMTTPNGSQIVEVTGNLSYTWHGEPKLAVGDHVLLRETWVSRLKHGPGPWAAKVTALGTNYTGALSSIIRRIELEDS